MRGRKVEAGGWLSGLVALLWAQQAILTNMKTLGQPHEIHATCIPLLPMDNGGPARPLPEVLPRGHEEGCWVGRWVRVTPKLGCDYCLLSLFACSNDHLSTESPSSFPPQALYTHCSLCQELCSLPSFLTPSSSSRLSARPPL